MPEIRDIDSAINHGGHTTQRQAKLTSLVAATATTFLAAEPGGRRPGYGSF